MKDTAHQSCLHFLTASWCLCPGVASLDGRGGGMVVVVVVVVMVVHWQ
jgi:hypothetical protein